MILFIYDIIIFIFLLLILFIFFNLILSKLYPDDQITVIIKLSTLLQCYILILMQIKLIAVALLVSNPGL